MIRLKIELDFPPAETPSPPILLRGRPEAAALCWHWRGAALPGTADPRAARRRGLRQTLIAMPIALLRC